MPFDSLPLLPPETRPDYRRRPDGSVDCDHYQRLARQEQARSLGRAMTGVTRLCGRAMLDLVNAWLGHRDRKRARHQILALDDRALRDIGLSRCDATQGVARQLWRP